MAFIIPNTTDTSGGEEYASPDQAEPDSLDFEIVGNRLNGVLSGCEVTSNGSATNVAVSAGIVVIGGRSYPVSASAALALPAAPTDSRFDAIVAREVGGSVTFVAVRGVESATNPLYPQSMNVYGGSYVSSSHVDFDHDTVLAVVLRVAGGVVTVKEIVDKRVFVRSGIFWEGTTVPSSGTGSNGDLFFKSDATGAKTGVYVKRNNEWVGLAKDGEVGVPIGGSIEWSGGSIPFGFLLENGAEVSRTTYADLFAAIGTRFGDGDGSTTFNLPNSDGRYTRGVLDVANIGQLLGNDQVTVTVGTLPSHAHPHDHQHNFDHVHSMTHQHSGGSTGPGGGHTHGAGSYSANTIGSGHTHPVSPGYASGFVAAFGGGNLGLMPGGTGQPANYTGAGAVITMSNSGTHTHDVQGTSGPADSHYHTFTVPQLIANTGSANPATTIDVTTTDAVGDGNPLDIRPRSIGKQKIIRAL